MKNGRKKIVLWLKETIEIKEKIRVAQLDSILSIAELLITSLKNGGKIILFGNGGSAADAQHIAAELLGRFRQERSPLAAIALTTNTSVITAIANDYDYNDVFARQLEALAKTGDIAFGISTSGNSENVFKGLLAAKQIGIKTVALTGKNGGKVSKLVEYNITVPSQNTAHIQEAHITIGHILCELVEREFITQSKKSSA